MCLEKNPLVTNHDEVDQDDQLEHQNVKNQSFGP